MPRPLRIEFPGAWHHVMNRGASKRDIFLDDNDRFFFLDLLAKSCEKNEVEVHAYCLMRNHFHLILRTPLGNMGEMMQQLCGVYARSFNDRYGRDGGLCRGRYRSIVVDSERYLLAVSRYVHRNPLAFWEGSLESYGWSSYPAFLGHRQAQDWLFTSETLDLVGGRSKYRGLVESPLPSDVDRLFEQPTAPAVIGSETFKANVSKRNVV